MRAAALSFMLCLASLAAQNAWARDAVLPAGTLVQCTLDEPNFSSATASVGDPVLCYPHGIQFFGQTLFPRGTYIVGHLADDKDPGHFWGKGYLKLEFDRIGLPSADVPLSAKIVSVSGGYRVDKDGKIIGKGHAKRDVAEWLFPPLWPWKVITLPARGPRPTLKGESRVTLRLMDDVLVPDAASFRHFGQLNNGGGEIYAHPALYIRPQKKLTEPSALSEPLYRSVSWEPQAVAASTQIGSSNAAPAVDHTGWHSFRKSAAPVTPSTVAAAEDANPDPPPSKSMTADETDDAAAAADNATAPVTPVKMRPAIQEQDIPPGAAAAPASAVPAVNWVVAPPEPVAAPATTADAATTTPAAGTQKPKLTLLAVRAGTVYAVTDYWRDEDQLKYVLSNGKEGQVDLSDLDWKTTTQLNTERNVKVTLREGR